jgi:hypothetical protein
MECVKSHLSILEHFQGNGRTYNAVRHSEGMPPDAGVVELVGPNRKISELHEVAIIHLGQLIIEDTYSTRDDRPQARKDTERSTSAAVQPSLAQP